MNDMPDFTSEDFKKTTTCWDCPDKDDCFCAFDPYNTDGDCLASK